MTDKYDDVANAIVKKELAAYYVSPKRNPYVSPTPHFDLRKEIASALRTASEEALRETHARGIADLLDLILTADRENGAGFDTLASATWDHIVACARKASKSIGTHAICSRCGGKDQACYDSKNHEADMVAE